MINGSEQEVFLSPLSYCLELFLSLLGLDNFFSDPRCEDSPHIFEFIVQQFSKFAIDDLCGLKVRDFEGIYACLAGITDAS